MMIGLILAGGPSKRMDILTQEQYERALQFAEVLAQGDHDKFLTGKRCPSNAIYMFTP